MEQLPSNRFRFHARIVNLMALLLIVDCVLADHAIRVTMVKGPNMMVMFGFEASSEAHIRSAKKECVLTIQYSIRY